MDTVDRVQFYKQQCAYIEKMFYGGAVNDSLRNLIDQALSARSPSAQPQQDQDSIEGGAAASIMTNPSSLNYDQLHESVDYGLNELDKLDEFVEQRSTKPLPRIEEEFDAEPTVKPTVEPTIETTVEPKTGSVFDTPLEPGEHILDRMALAMAQQTDVANNPEWIRQGIDQVTKLYKDSTRLKRTFFRNNEQMIENMFDIHGNIVAPIVSLDSCHAWFNRILTYVGNVDLNSVPFEQLVRLYFDVSWYVQKITILAMMPVQPEWLKFQMYMMDRLGKLP